MYPSVPFQNFAQSWHYGEGKKQWPNCFVLFFNIHVTLGVRFVALREQMSHLALIPSYVRKIMIMFREFKMSLLSIHH